MDEQLPLRDQNLLYDRYNKCEVAGENATCPARHRQDAVRLVAARPSKSAEHQV